MQKKAVRVKNMGRLQERLQHDMPSSTIENKLKKQKGRFYKKKIKYRKNHFVRVEKSIAPAADEELEHVGIKKEREQRKKDRKLLKKQKLYNVVLTTLCVYMIFLIYGVCVTDYSYNDKGQIEANIMSLRDITVRENFNVILTQYLFVRQLYEKILILDYRLGQGVEDPRSLATEYEGLLTEVEALSIKTDALDTEIKYSQIKDMLLLWVSDDAAIYLQKMSSAISADNAEDAEIALMYKTYMYDDFSILSENIVIIGADIKGIDIIDVRKWSPEGYIDDTIKGNGGHAL